MDEKEDGKMVNKVAQSEQKEKAGKKDEGMRKKKYPENCEKGERG